MTRASSQLGLPTNVVTNVVSVMQCIFGLLGETKLALAFGLLKWHSHSNSHLNEFVT